jgi:hypothetical protein
VVDVRENDIRESIRRAEERHTAGAYGEGALDEVTVPPNDVQRVIQDEDPGDPADVPIDPPALRDGGPTRGQGAITTTGGTAGASAAGRAAAGTASGKVAPTTGGRHHRDEHRWRSIATRPARAVRSGTHGRVSRRSTGARRAAASRVRRRKSLRPRGDSAMIRLVDQHRSFQPSACGTVRINTWFQLRCR